MGISELLKEKREGIIQTAESHGAKNVRVFGSAVRDELTEDSDIDFLVDVEKKHSSWFPAGLKIDLEKLLNRKVDVLTEDSIYWLLKRKILKEAVPL